ncbi:hypothetical protein CHUAL_002052 [Chamberlinius hualienensis]
MNSLRITFLLGLGLIVCVSAYSDKSSYSGAAYRPAAPARLRNPAPVQVSRPAELVQTKSIHRQAQPARLQAPSYQVQFHPVSVVLPSEKPKAQPIQQQPTYENRVPHPVFRPSYVTPAPVKSIQFQAPSYEQQQQKIEFVAPAPAAPSISHQQAAFILPAYQTVQPAKFTSGYGEESENKGKEEGGDDDDEDDDEESGDEKQKAESEDEKRPVFAQQPVALTYPAFEGYKAQQIFQQVQTAPKQPIYQVQYQRPVQYSYPQVSLEAPKAEGQEEEEESYPDDLSAIPGEAGKDYPNLHRLPEDIYFSCDDKLPGYYADVDYKCQVWHFCNDGRRQSFLCPNGTIYSQEKFVCEWWFNVDCSSSSSHFGRNEDLYKVPVKVEAPEAQPQPQYAYEQPQQAYERPQQVYERPQQSYERPQQSYEQPQQQPPYTVTLPASVIAVPQQPQVSSAIYQVPAPAPIKAQKIVKQSRPAYQPAAQYVKSSQLQQQPSSYY